MARRKTEPELVQAKQSLSERLRKLRTELFGERGGPELARRLGLPVRTWYNYESGVTVPAEVVLKLIEMTFVEPAWLLHGQNPQFRTQKGDGLGGDRISTQSVSEMLRTVVDILEKNVGEYPVHAHNRIIGSNGTGDSLPLHPSYDSTHAVNSENGFAAVEFAPMASGLDFRSEKNTCVRNVGDSMLPIVADGASVAYSQERENAAALDGKLVVAWIEGKPVVRWFQLCGRYGMLRAENAASDATQVLVDLENSPQEASVRRVLWISTPH